MRLRLLVSAGMLLVALSPCLPCRALLSRGSVSGAPRAPQPLNFLQPEQPQQPQPILIRMGEEYFLRLGNLNRSPAARLSPNSTPLTAGRGSRPSHDQAAANFFRVLLQQLQMPQRPLDSSTELAERGAEDALGGHQGALERDWAISYQMNRELAECVPKLDLFVCHCTSGDWKWLISYLHEF